MFPRHKTPSPDWREVTPPNWTKPENPSPQQSRSSNNTASGIGMKRKQSVFEYPYVAVVETGVKRCNRPTIHQLMTNYQKNAVRVLTY